VTLSPFETRQVRPRSDLPSYELNLVCAVPGCHFDATDNHHAHNRGMGWPKKSDYWWVELPGGELVPVRVGLCREAHDAVTDHRAWIKWNGSGFEWHVRRGDEWLYVGLLNPQPAPLIERAAA
jgi:hypothetical protein